MNKAACRAQVPLGFWSVRDFYDTAELQQLQAMSATVFAAIGNRMHKPNTTKEGGTYYRTLAAAKHPCSCRYEYAGFKATREAGYRVWGDENDTDPEMREANQLFRRLTAPFRDRLGIDELRLPDLVLGNMYAEETEHIGEHSDSHPLFDSGNGPTLIISINLQADGIFYGKFFRAPNVDGAPTSSELQEHKTHFKNALAREAGGDSWHWSQKMNNADIEGPLHTSLTVPVAAEENSVIFMSGEFQTLMMHGTVPLACQRPAGSPGGITCRT